MTATTPGRSSVPRGTTGSPPAGTGRATSPMSRVAAALLLLGAALAGWLVFLHVDTGCHVCVLPASAPQRLHVDGRDYDRGRATTLPAGVRRLGLTLGGGQIYDQPVPGMTIMGVWVRDRQGTVHEYGLLGGP